MWCSGRTLVEVPPRRFGVFSAHRFKQTIRHCISLHPWRQRASRVDGKTGERYSRFGPPAPIPAKRCSQDPCARSTAKGSNQPDTALDLRRESVIHNLPTRSSDPVSGRSSRLADHARRDCWKRMENRKPAEKQVSKLRRSTGIRTQPVH